MTLVSIVSVGTLVSVVSVGTLVSIVSVLKKTYPCKDPAWGQVIPTKSPSFSRAPQVARDTKCLRHC